MHGNKRKKKKTAKKKKKCITVSNMNGIVSPFFHDDTRACIDIKSGDKF